MYQSFRYELLNFAFLRSVADEKAFQSKRRGVWVYQDGAIGSGSDSESYGAFSPTELS